MNRLPHPRQHNQSEITASQAYVEEQMGALRTESCGEVEALRTNLQEQITSLKDEVTALQEKQVSLETIVERKYVSFLRQQATYI